MSENLILLTDSYKVTHYPQYPPEMAFLQSRFDARVGAKFPYTVAQGLQGITGEHLSEPVMDHELDEAIEMTDAHFGSRQLNVAGWRQIVNEFGGSLPIRIWAVPEGEQVKIGEKPLMVVENTVPGFGWLVNYLETLLVQAWYPSTVCTQSREMKRVILHYMDRTGNINGADFKLHDFGFRGSTSVQSAAIGGTAHLVNFKGTDTMAALRWAKKYYKEPMAGFSIPAAEHSTITAWGKARETDAYRNMLQKYPTGLVAVVSDSYDLINACRNIWGGSLKENVIARDGVLVVRPDSGDAVANVVAVHATLAERFGYERNSKGYKTLHPKLAIIQGDGIEGRGSLIDIYSGLVGRQFSAQSLAFGSGGGLLQKLNRDTQRFAFKACAAINYDGTVVPVGKSPVTDPTKASPAGLVEPKSLGLRIVYEDGKFYNQDTLTDIRQRAEIKEHEYGII